MTSLLLAFQFLTVLPIPGRSLPQPHDFARSLRWFWLAGLLIGSLQYGAAIAFTEFRVPPHWTSVVIVCIGYWLTGGLHLDGVADATDGFGAGRDRDSILRIMSDSRLGAYGVAAIVLLIYCKIQATRSLLEADAAHALLLAPMLSRGLIAVTCRLMPYAKENGKGKYFASGSSWIDVVAGVLCCAILIQIFFAEQILQIIVPAVVVFVFFSIYVFYKIRGFTGDTLGCQNELIELVVCISAATVSN